MVLWGAWHRVGKREGVRQVTEIVGKGGAEERGLKGRQGGEWRREKSGERQRGGMETW